MIEELYRGFDGLDISFQGQIGSSLEKELNAAKIEAQKCHTPIVIDWKGVKLQVADTGARGGYAYRASTGAFGATWFFKKPNNRDLWGIRASCNSLLLATYGIGETRHKLYGILDALDARVSKNNESIGRVDYAIDFLAPDFELVPGHFVMHSNTNRTEYIEQENISANGNSGRVTSVTVGKMPGRQIIIYDKRAEVIAKHKMTWWEIWNAGRSRNHLDPLNWRVPEESRVWRVELRAGKEHLKNRWNIRSWHDLYNRFGDLMIASSQAIRHTVPGNDTNRSHWADSALWSQVRQRLEIDLFEMRNFAEPDLIKHVHKQAHSQLIENQSIGLLITRAAINGIDPSELADFALAHGREIARKIETSPEKFAQKLSKAGERYAVHG